MLQCSSPSRRKFTVHQSTSTRALVPEFPSKESGVLQFYSSTVLQFFYSFTVLQFYSSTVLQFYIPVLSVGKTSVPVTFL